MSDLALNDRGLEAPVAPAPATLSADVRPVPRISLQAFCESPDVAASIESAAGDRRMARAHVKVHTGGLTAAAEFYQAAATPNLIIVESKLSRARLEAELDRLAAVCDPGTKVVVIGQTNDVELYRNLIQRGVSEYLVAPIDKMGIIRAISDLYVERAFAEETAAAIRGLRPWITNEFEHNALRADGDRVLGRLIDLVRGRA
jgi:pilus assembly protein CpaE